MPTGGGWTGHVQAIRAIASLRGPTIDQCLEQLHRGHISGLMGIFQWANDYIMPDKVMITIVHL